MKHLIGFLVVLMVGLAALSFVPPGTQCDCGRRCGCGAKCSCSPLKRCDEPCCDCLTLPCRGGEK